MVGFIFECFLHSRFGLHTVFGCQRSCGLYDLSVSYLSIGSGKLTMTFLWAFQDSNLRPRPYQRRALTS